VSELNQRSLAALGELADEPVEQTGPTSDFVYVDISSIDRETKIITEAKDLTLSQAPSRAKQLLRAGDVLVSMTRPNLNAVALVPEQLDGAIGSTGFHVLRSRWLRPEFLLRLVQSQRFVDEMSALVQGALYPAVRPKDIAAFTFAFETPAQQSRIVAKLEELLSDLDAGVAELKAAQKKLTQYRQSLLKAAVEGSLTAEWRAKNTPAETGAQLVERILAERRARWEDKQLAKFKEQGKTPTKDWQKKYPEPVQPDTSALPVLPQGWVWATIEQIASDEPYSLAIGPFGSNLKVHDYRESGVPLVFVRNIRSGNYGGVQTKHVTREKAEELSAHRVEAGDVLITKMGEPPGDADVYPHDQPPAIITADCIKVSCWTGLIRPVFLKAVINSHIGRKQIEPMTQGVAQKKVSLGRFTSLAVPVPPIQEQDELIALVVTATNEIAAQEAAVGISLKQSAAQRQNILRAAFAGQLVPQDPNDEPASVLLERIRAERAAGVQTTKGRRARTVRISA
jgi:type I restriction enzyme S subunit